MMHERMHERTKFHKQKLIEMKNDQTKSGNDATYSGQNFKNKSLKKMKDNQNKRGNDASSNRKRKAKGKKSRAPAAGSDCYDSHPLALE